MTSYENIGKCMKSWEEGTKRWNSISNELFGIIGFLGKYNRDFVDKYWPEENFSKNGPREIVEKWDTPEMYELYLNFFKTELLRIIDVYNTTKPFRYFKAKKYLIEKLTNEKFNSKFSDVIDTMNISEEMKDKIRELCSTEYTKTEEDYYDPFFVNYMRIYINTVIDVEKRKDYEEYLDLCIGKKFYVDIICNAIDKTLTPIFDPVF